MFRFAHPEYLYLFIIVPIITGLFIYTQYLRRKKIKLFGNPELLAELMPNISYKRPHVKFYIQLLAVALIIIILAQPQFGTKVEKDKRKGIEVMIALDVSNSMLAQDLQPNRLEKSKQLLSKLVDEMVEDKVGLVVFAGDAYTQLPITVDYVSAKTLSLATIKTRVFLTMSLRVSFTIKSFSSKPWISFATGSPKAKSLSANQSDTSQYSNIS